MFWCPKAQIL